KTESARRSPSTMENLSLPSSRVAASPVIGVPLDIETPLHVDMARIMACRFDAVPGGDEFVVGARFFRQTLAFGAGVVEPVGQAADVAGLLGHARQQRA